MELIKIKDTEFDNIYEEMEKNFAHCEIRDRDEAYALLSHPRYTLYHTVENGEHVGFISAWELPSFTFLEHFVTYEAHRNKGLGKKVLCALKEMFPNLVLEAEPPISDITKRRVAFYQRNGFHIEPHPYYQPAYRKEESGFELILMSYPCRLADTEKAIEEIYRYVYGAELSAAPKSGLMLEGGGMRGMYTAGVLDVFMENGIRFDGVIGVSAGAIHGSSFVSEQYGRSIRYYKKYCKDPRFISKRNLILTGNIVGTDFCYDEIPNKLDPFDYETFRNSKTAFYAVCTNMLSGEAECMRIFDMETETDKIRASASLPLVSKPVEINGSPYLDGGCADGLPIDALYSLGYTKNVLVLTRPKGFIRKPERPIAAKLKYRKYPKFVSALISRHTNYNKSLAKIDKMEENGDILVIRPDKALDISRLENDHEKLQAVYNCGVSDGKKYLYAVEKWLNIPKQ